MKPSALSNSLPSNEGKFLVKLATANPVPMALHLSVLQGFLIASSLTVRVLAFIEIV